MTEKLVFPQGYFEDEEREGFLVESMMKRAWAAQLVVLQEIDRICKKHNITYFADFGTLLGAVRHKGFIPWDDDMDISMKRKDFQKFLQVVDKEFTGEYRLHTAERKERYGNTFPRVVNSHQISFTNERMEEFFGFPYIVGVDIFILDALPREKEEQDILHSIMVILFGTLEACMKGEESIEENLLKIEEFLKVKIDRKGNVRQQILILIDKVGQLYGEDEADEFSTVSGFAKSQNFRLKKEWYRETVYLPFENILVPAPIDYASVLSYEYGDYLKPVRGNNHDYPFYKKQQRALEETLGVKL